MPSPSWRGSLKRRVTVGAVAVSLAALLAVVGLTFAITPVLLDRAADRALDAAEQSAGQLAANNTAPRDLVARVQSGSVRAALTLAGGRRLGELDARSPARTRTIALDAAGPPLAGARLTLQFDAPARSLLFGPLLIVAAVVAVLVLIVMPWVARVALAPLDRMTALARDIAGGRRGQRLNAGDEAELGRAAAAFDDMLDALEGAERRALSSERALRRFVADAAHELRTPIAGIGAAAEAALALPGTVAPQQQKLLLALGREARHAGRLVEDLLDLARIDTGLRLSKESVDIRRICVEQAERAMLVVPRARVVVQGPPTVAWADAARIGQVVANLVNNACAVTPAGETVHVLVSASPTVVTVTVTDRGPGVPEAQREEIFDRLVRLDVARSSGKGVGLGLTIARGIARAHGGDVRCCAPAPGTRGAVFELVLPIGLGPGPRSADPGRSQQP
ncbi:HAMP domain-containing histidine kinase [Mycolicibacterium madagascariense]|nr:HAMP domain-containing histidine kinase [Mycolicibacterium madagascariense]